MDVVIAEVEAEDVVKNLGPKFYTIKTEMNKLDDLDLRWVMERLGELQAHALQLINSQTLKAFFLCYSLSQAVAESF